MDKLLLTGLFARASSWKIDMFRLKLIDTGFTYYAYSKTWEESFDSSVNMRCDIEYVLENVSEDIQTALLFNLELLK